MANLFTDSELKAIATQAIGNGTGLSVEQMISNSEELIDTKVKQKIEEQTNNLMNGIDSVGNTTTDLTSNPNIPISLPNDSQNIVNNSQNIMGSLQGRTNIQNLSGNLPGLSNAPSATSVANIPQIPSVPSISSAIPGGLSLDPMEYIPEPDIPFKAFIKPLLDKAISKALGKFNPASFVQKAEGSLGKLQAKATSNLQSLQNKVQNGMEKAANDAAASIKDQIDTKTKSLGEFAKSASKEGQKAKSQVNNYIRLYFLRTTDPAKYNLDPGVNDFLRIYNAR